MSYHLCLVALYDTDAFRAPDVSVYSVCIRTRELIRAQRPCSIAEHEPCQHRSRDSINGGTVQDRFPELDYENGPLATIASFNDWLTRRCRSTKTWARRDYRPSPRIPARYRPNLLHSWRSGAGLAPDCLLLRYRQILERREAISGCSSSRVETRKPDETTWDQRLTGISSL